MLALDDDRWQLLTSFFGEAQFIPLLLSEWLLAIGTDQEYFHYHHDLFDTFLHQATITNAAFAIVPWLIHVCEQKQTPFQVEYLTHVALVEANRLTGGVHFNHAGTEPYPNWLMQPYFQAIARTRDLIDEVIEAEQDEERKHGLVAMRPALYGNAALAWSQW